VVSLGGKRCGEKAYTRDERSSVQQPEPFNRRGFLPNAPVQAPAVAWNRKLDRSRVSVHR
jgi:hypothetical protein